MPLPSEPRPAGKPGLAGCTRDGLLEFHWRLMAFLGSPEGKAWLVRFGDQVIIERQSLAWSAS